MTSTMKNETTPNNYTQNQKTEDTTQRKPQHLDTTTEYDSNVFDDMKQQVMMLKVQNSELQETIEENRMGMIAYEHLCQVIEKLSILLIRTDRGIYKKKNIDRRNNIIAKSITMSAYQK